MGAYLNYEIETRCEDPEIVALALSGMVGELFSVKNKENGIVFVSNATDELLFQCKVTHGEGMEIFTCCEKSGCYENASADRFSEGSLAERLAEFLGDCKVTISADKGVTPHPDAANGVYSYHTEPKEDRVWKSKDAVRESIENYPPVLIAKEMHEDKRDDKRERELLVARTMHQNRFLFESQSSRSNAMALSYFSGKELENITSEDARRYATRDKSPVPVGKVERTSGITDLFWKMGKPDVYEALGRERAKGLEENAARKLFERKVFEVRNSFYNIEYERNEEEGRFFHKGKSFFLFGDRILYAYKNDTPSAMLDMPMGFEQVRVDVSDTGAVSYLYKAVDISSYTSSDELRRVSSDSLYEILGSIKSPSLLEHMLRNIPHDNPFLSLAERQALNAKLPEMRQDEKEAREFMRATLCYLNVPYAEKDEAKALGAKWDSRRKSWLYDPRDPKIPDTSVFEKWAPEDARRATQEKDDEDKEER